jgi:hypothetical protein
VKKPLNPRLLSDLATLLAEYEPDELRAALEILANPVGIATLGNLVNQAIEAGIHRKTRRLRAIDRSRESDDERIAAIKAARPQDAFVIDKVLANANRRWSKSRVERLRDLIGRYGEAPITGKSNAARRAQLISLIERAPLALLKEIAEEFPPERQEGATLQEWSDIILQDRKPRA